MPRGNTLPVIETTEQLSTAQLVHQLTEHATTLVKQEIRLAQLEMAVKAKRAGVGIGALAVTAVLGLYLGGALVAAAILGLATALDGWLAALIVSGALLLPMVALALVGKSQLSRAVPPAPQQAIASTRDDVSAIKKAARR